MPESTGPGTPSLRERKFARTKVALLNAATRRMREQRRLEDIPVKELCEEAQVSEATFFNYFPKKSDLLLYFVQLWTIEAGARTRDLRGIEAIEGIFDISGVRFEQNPSLMLELIAQLALCHEMMVFPEVSLAERLEAFPDLPGVADVDVRRNLGDIFGKEILWAVDRGELPPTTDVLAAGLALASLFFGVPLMTHYARVTVSIRNAYRQQLAILWAGLRAQGGPP